MKLARREKRTAIIGTAVAALTVLITWVLLPSGREWSALGDQLGPKLRQLRVLQARADGQRALLARRARLIRQVGSLLDPADARVSSAQKEDGGSGQTGGEGTKPGENTADRTASDPDGAIKAGGQRMEAELEKIFKQCGAKMQLVSPKGVPRGGEPLKYFKMISLRIDGEAQVESLVKTLHALEKGPRLIRVDRLEVHQDLNKPGALSVTLEIAAYEPADGA